MTDALICERIREVVRDHGPITRMELEERLGIARTMKGTRSQLSTLIGNQVRAGQIRKEPDGRLSYIGEPVKKESVKANTEKVRRYLIENGPTSVLMLADGLDMWPSSVKLALKKNGTASKGKNPVLYYIPEGSE